MRNFLVATALAAMLASNLVLADHTTYTKTVKCRDAAAGDLVLENWKPFEYLRLPLGFLDGAVYITNPATVPAELNTVKTLSELFLAVSESKTGVIEGVIVECDRDTTYKLELTKEFGFEAPRKTTDGYHSGVIVPLDVIGDCVINTIKLQGKSRSLSGKVRVDLLAPVNTGKTEL